MSKNPSLEIERKFLVTKMPDLLSLQRAQLQQGYLTEDEDSIEVRLRQSGEACFMTVKSGGGLQRSELEIAITQSQFVALWPATAGRRIEKTRFKAALDAQLTFELDVFSGSLAPLVMVEVEFASVMAATSFVPPNWFGADVTNDARFKNKALAIHDLPDLSHPVLQR